MRMKKCLKKVIALIIMTILLFNDLSVAYAFNDSVNEVHNENNDDGDNIEVYSENNKENDDSDISTEGNNEINTESNINDENSINNDSDIIEQIDDISNSDYIENGDLLKEESIDDLTVKSSTTLSEDMTVGNLYINQNSTLDLNGHMLKVTGDICIENGNILFNSGEIYCDGNFNIERNGRISMNTVNDYLYIEKKINIYKDIQISNGTIEVCGDINFISSVELKDNNRFILSGHEKQIINMNDNSIFNIIELKNYSEDGIFINYYFKYNQLIQNNCVIEFNKLEGERGFRLEEDTVVDGTYYLVADILDLNGHTLTINGDLIQSGGDIKINGGSLVVNGDYRVQTICLSDENEEQQSFTYEAGIGSLYMENTDDYVLVNGNYINHNSKKQDCTLTDGIMEVKGDFILKYSYNGQNSSDNYSFLSSKNHTLILSGEKEQKIDIEYSYFKLDGSNINNIELKNTSEEGIVLVNPTLISGKIAQNDVKINGIIITDSNTKFKEKCYYGDIISYNTTFADGMEIFGNIEIHKSNFSSDSAGLVAEGNMFIYGDLISKSYDCYVNVLNSGVLFISGNSKNINYNYSKNKITICGDYISDYAYSLGCDELEVRGNVNAKNGLYLKKLVLAGDSLQQITNANKLNIDTLEVVNFSEDGVCADHSIMSKELICNGCKLKYNDCEFVSDWTLDKDEVYDGDLILCGCSIDLNGHKLTVNGDVIHSSGIININKGILEVNGDYRMQSILDIDNEIYGNSRSCLIMSNPEDVLLVKGTLYYGNIERDKLTDGIIEINGDILKGEAYSSDIYNLVYYNYKTNYNGELAINDNCTLKICGDKKQIIKEKIYASRLEIDNESSEGVIIQDEVNVYSYINDHDSNIDGYISVFNNIEFADDDFSASMYIYGVNSIKQKICILGNLDVHRELTIDADIEVCGDVNVYGDFGNIVLNNATLNISGNCNINNNAYIKVTNINDVLNIKGDFTYKGKKPTITNGVISVSGDCDIMTFAASGNNKFVMNGTNLQNITANSSSFNIFQIDNNSEDGVLADNYIYAKQIINNGKFKYKDIDGEFGWTLNEDEEYYGDLTLCGGILDLNGHTLVVHGNYTQNMGSVNLNGGKMYIDGDFIISSGGFIINSGDYLYVEGNFSSDKKMSFGGIVECKGNVYSKEKLSIYGRDSKFILSGDDKQIIDVSYDSTFTVVEIKNVSDEGIYSKNYLNITKLIDDNKKLYIASGDYKTGYVLENDIVIDGDYFLGYGTLDLNGYTLTVNGDFNQADADIIINGGMLDIKGDFRQQIKYNTEGESTWMYSNGLLVMDNPNDKVFVGKDIYFQAEKSKFNFGSIYISGDIYRDRKNYQLIFDDDFTVVLCGKEKQKIDERLEFSNLEVDNDISLILNDSVYVHNDFKANKVKSEGRGLLTVDDIERINVKEFDGRIVIKSACTLSGDINIKADLSFSDKINLNGHELDVNSAVIYSEFIVNEGRLNCSDNLNIVSDGLLNMTKEADYIYVGGNFEFESRKNHEGYLNAGTIELNGDFIQNNYDFFIADGTHKVVINNKLSMSGREYIQTLKFYNSTGNSIFNKLVLSKSADKYVFSRNVNDMAREVVFDIHEDNPPEKPTEINITGVTSLSITFEIASDDDNNIGYEIYRDGNRIAVISKSIFTDNNLKYNTAYNYDVYSLDAYMNRSIAPVSISVSTLDDTDAPTVPSDINICKITGSSMSISWKASTDNRIVEGYDVYRNGEYIASTKETSFSDTNLSIGNIYEYKIVAYDDAGNKSDYSEMIKIEPQNPEIISVYPGDYKKLSKPNTQLGVSFKKYGKDAVYSVCIEYYDLTQHGWFNITDDEIKIYDNNLESCYANVSFVTNTLTDTEYIIRYTITDEDGNTASKKVKY